MLIWLLTFLAQDKEAIGRGATLATELKSYTVHYTMTIEGQGEQAIDLVFDGGYTEEDGMYLSGSYLTAPLGLYRKGDKTAVIDSADKTWKNAEDVKPSGGRRAPPGKNFQLPHVEIRGIDEKLDRIKRSGPEHRAGVSCDVYTGELTDAGARSFLPRGGELGGRVKPAGDVKLWIDPQTGRIIEYMICFIVDGSYQDKAFRITTTRHVTFSKFNGTTLNIPKEARDAIK
jgi:hypothetical protein